MTVFLVSLFVCVCFFLLAWKPLNVVLRKAILFSSTQLSRNKASSANLYYIIRLLLFFQFEGATRLFAVGRRILEPIEIMDLFLVSGTVFL